MFPWEQVDWIASWLQRSKVPVLSVQLVSNISNLCDHKSPTSQTDKQTDDMRSLCTIVHRAVIKLVGAYARDPAFSWVYCQHV